MSVKDTFKQAALLCCADEMEPSQVSTYVYIVPPCFLICKGTINSYHLISGNSAVHPSSTESFSIFQFVVLVLWLLSKHPHQTRTQHQQALVFNSVSTVADTGELQEH